MKKLLMALLLLVCVDGGTTDLIIWKESNDSITLDRYSAQRIFTKKITRWPNGQHINVFIKPLYSIEHRDFVINVLGISPFYYTQMLEEQTYTGKASSITEVNSDKQMIMMVDQTPGSIGYINYEIFAGNKRVIVIDPATL